MTLIRSDVAPVHDHGLGRLPAIDERDKLHPMKMALEPRRAPIVSRIWSGGPVLDQGSTSQCVAYSWTQFLTSAPLMTKLARLPGQSRFMADVYREAQKVDEWPGEGYDGTSVRAGAKVLMTLDRLVEYVWAETMDDLIRYVTTQGPVVGGTDWTEAMFDPRKYRGHLVPEGATVGGHAYLFVGYSRERDAFRIINSWGRLWGSAGRAWILRKNVATLWERGAEFCAAIEKRAA